MLPSNFRQLRCILIPTISLKSDHFYSTGTTILDRIIELNTPGHTIAFIRHRFANQMENIHWSIIRGLNMNQELLFHNSFDHKIV